MKRFYHELSKFTICFAVILSAIFILIGASILLYPSFVLKVFWLVLAAGFLIAGIGILCSLAVALFSSVVQSHKIKKGGNTTE